MFIQIRTGTVDILKPLCGLHIDLLRRALKMEKGAYLLVNEAPFKLEIGSFDVLGGDLYTKIAVSVCVSQMFELALHGNSSAPTVVVENSFFNTSSGERERHPEVTASFT
jgi:hypothetical protein